jgi:hypothetical protein
MAAPARAEGATAGLTFSQFETMVEVGVTDPGWVAEVPEARSCAAEFIAPIPAFPTDEPPVAAAPQALTTTIRITATLTNGP